ncbi:uncharacterized protein LOC142139068 isoform X5 [Mixophyes fleayi]|uniref:uncharacterized protein LOC142139068 isoform X5 n=1 Tax=Mixophyes fleayi TaxID=3061075 RepID=UPI003F4DBF9F
MSRPRRSAGPPARLSDGSQLPAGSLRPPVTLSSSSPSSEALGALPESVHPSAVNIAAGDSPVAGSQRRSGQGGRGGARRSRAPERSAALAASGDASAAVQHSQQRRRSPSPTSARSSQSSLPPRSPPPNLAGQVSPRAAGGEGSLQALASSYSSPVGNHLIAVNEVNLESQHVSVSATSHRPWLHSSSGDSIPQINIIPPLMPQGWIRGRVRPHMAHNVSFQPMLSSQLHTPSPPQVGPPIQYNFISPIQAANVPLQRLPYSDSINVGGHPSALVQSGSFQQSPNTTLSPWARPAVAQVEAPHGNLPPWSLPYPPPNPDRVQRPMQNWMAPYPPPYVSSYGHASNASITNIPVPDLNSSPFGFGSSQDLARPPAPGFSFGTPVPIESLNSISGVRVNQSFVSEVANIHSVSVTAVSGGGAAAPLPEVITVTGSSALQTEPAGDSASREETSTQALALPGTSAQSGLKINIWIMGHSFVYWASKHHLANEWSNFPCPVDIKWMGKRGLCWPFLLSWLEEELAKSQHPDIIVLHLGGNDVGKTKSLALIISIREDLRAIRARWPTIGICWSNIVPRLYWRFPIRPSTLTRLLRKINSVTGKLVRELGGVEIFHPSIKADNTHLFRPDGVHLNKEGMGFFIREIYEQLGSWFCARGGGLGTR